jgi:site-specific recombinase XerC
MELQAVKGTHIQKLYNSMIKAGLSGKLVQNVSTVLHKAFSVAIKQGVIRTNPCDGAERPKAERRKIKPLSDSEIPLFLAAIEDSPMRNAYALCLFAGLRKGGAPGPVVEAGGLSVGEDHHQSTTPAEEDGRL